MHKVELPLAEKAAKEHVAVTRKTAVEQTRPVSRHKPPVQSLFLEVPETRRQIPPSYSTTVAGTDSCGGPTPGRYGIDGSDMEASTVCWSSQCLRLYSFVDVKHMCSTRIRCNYRAPTMSACCEWAPPEAPSFHARGCLPRSRTFTDNMVCPGCRVEGRTSPGSYATFAPA